MAHEKTGPWAGFFMSDLELFNFENVEMPWRPRERTPAPEAEVPLAVREQSERRLRLKQGESWAEGVYSTYSTFVRGEPDTGRG